MALEKLVYNYIIVLFLFFISMCYLEPRREEKNSLIGPIVSGIVGFAFLCGIAFLAYLLHKRIQNKEVQRRRRLELILKDLDQQTLNKNVVQMIQNVQRNIYVPLDLVLQQSLVDLDSDGPLYQDVPQNGKV